MKIVIAGGTGLIGSYLFNKFSQRGDTVIVVSRLPGQISWNHNDLLSALEGADLLINLAGKTINCRHNKKNKIAILKSRIDTTAKLGNAVLSCKVPPRLWINASASAIYSANTIKPAGESSNELSNDFLANVVREWETQFFSFQQPQTRQVALRTSVVLSNSGGAFVPLFWLTKFGLGGKQGSGKQQFSWIHIEDYYNIILFLISNSVTGLVNCTSPNPVTNAKLMQAFRLNIGIRLGLPAPEFAVKIGATIIGTEPGLLLQSSYLWPETLINKGFKFKFPLINDAIADLIKK